MTVSPAHFYERFLSDERRSELPPRLAALAAG
jgi:hypothetical protein